MKRRKISILNWRVLASLIAILAILAAVTLWFQDGAWPYGAMPDKGVIRTALFAVSGITCLVVSLALTRSHEGKDD